MWDWRQLRWLSYLGWWPDHCKTRTAYNITRAYGIALFLWDVVQVVPECLAMYIGLVNNSLKGTVLNLNTSLVGFLCFWKIGGFALNKAQVKWIIAKLGEMDERAKKIIPRQEYDKTSNNGNKNCKRFSIVVVLFLFTVGHWCLRPIYLLFYGTKAFIIEAWVPWDTDSTQGWAIVYLSQFIHVPTCVMGNLIIDVVYMSVLEMILGQIDHLKVALSNLDFTPSGVDNHHPSTLRFCIAFHQDILLLCDKFNKMVRVTLFVSIMLSTTCSCLFCFELTSLKDSDVFRIMNLAEVSIFLLLTIFLYCWYCHHVVDQMSEGISRAVYNNNWYLGRHQDKRALFIIGTVSKRPIRFGYIVPVNLDTYITVMKSAFSYYNFLKALSVEE